MKNILLLLFLLMGTNLGFGQIFEKATGSAPSYEHKNFIAFQEQEINKRATLWKVPSLMVGLVATIQSNAGTAKGFNYGKVKSAPIFTRYTKFQRVDDKGLVYCEKRSRGIEAIAMALNVIKTQKGPFHNEKEWLEGLFTDGPLSNRKLEAQKAYEAITGIKIPIKILSNKEVADVPKNNQNSTRVYHPKIKQKILAKATTVSMTPPKNISRTTASSEKKPPSPQKKEFNKIISLNVVETTLEKSPKEKLTSSKSPKILEKRSATKDEQANIYKNNNEFVLSAPPQKKESSIKRLLNKTLAGFNQPLNSKDPSRFSELRPQEQRWLMKYGVNLDKYQMDNSTINFHLNLATKHKKHSNLMVFGGLALGLAGWAILDEGLVYGENGVAILGGGVGIIGITSMIIGSMKKKKAKFNANRVVYLLDDY